MSYNFKNIKSIPAAADMVNIVLSKTQRKTPTVVHPGYAISRIRSFYMRKIKFCQQTISQKLVDALEHFPKIQDIHPFYADLFNVLYDKDHYKLALGHLKATKNMCENMCKDYLKLVKYADSLYRCKSLKRAALGRMCTMIRKIGSSLSYLEQVRKHLGRLPSINPYQRTLMLTGYPNVGKSSLINALSKANVQVQPYPFTTKALYVGHTDYKTTRFQIIDSPGVLDHNLQEMNTIQMQSVTALAHLKSCVLYLIDPSEQCGYSIQQQIKLYGTLKPLFKNKPLVIVFSKSDVKKVQDLPANKKSIIQNWIQQNNLKFTTISSMSGDNLDGVKQLACEQVMKLKLAVPENKIVKSQQNYINGLYVSKPIKRDNVQRPSVSVDLSKKVKKQKTIRQIQQQNGGAGVFDIPIQQHYILPEQWKYDLVPQFYNGKNVADFVDADIWAKLEELQKQQEQILELEGLKIQDQQNPFTSQKMQALNDIKRKKHAFRQEHALKRGKTAHPTNKNINQIKQSLQQQGLDASLVQQRLRGRSRSRSLAQIKAKRGGDMQDQNMQDGGRIRERIRQASRSRSKGFRRQMSVQQVQGKKTTDKLSKVWRTMDKKGQSDRFIGTARPRHLFSGKTGKGARDRR